VLLQALAIVLPSLLQIPRMQAVHLTHLAQLQMDAMGALIAQDTLSSTRTELFGGLSLGRIQFPGTGHKDRCIGPHPLPTVATGGGHLLILLLLLRWPGIHIVGESTVLPEPTDPLHIVAAEGSTAV